MGISFRPRAAGWRWRRESGTKRNRSSQDRGPGVARRGKEISINAFYANTPGQNWVGLWSHPKSKAMQYTSLDYWVELARLAERGLFDSIFFADTGGVYDVFEGSPRAAIERAAMFPMNDPLLLIPTMAYVTRHLELRRHRQFDL